MKYIPNLLSCCRMVLTACLFFVAPGSVWFFLLYALCGVTDVADGCLARRWHCATATGARLDTAADLCFFLAVLYHLWATAFPEPGSLLLRAVLCVLLLRLFNLVLTRVKFRQWNVVHTVGNKLTGLLLFLLLPAVFLFPGASPVLCGALAVVALGASLEECAILLCANDYDANRKGLWVLRNATRL